MTSTTVREAVGSLLQTNGNLSYQVSVGATATSIQSTTQGVTRRRTIIIYNTHSTETCYIGGSGVTTSNGMPCYPSSHYGWAFTLDVGETIYAIRGATEVTLNVFEIYND